MMFADMSVAPHNEATVHKIEDLILERIATLEEGSASEVSLNDVIAHIHSENTTIEPREFTDLLFCMHVAARRVLPHCVALAKHGKLPSVTEGVWMMLVEPFSGTVNRTQMMFSSLRAAVLFRLRV